MFDEFCNRLLESVKGKQSSMSDAVSWVGRALGLWEMAATHDDLIATCPCLEAVSLFRLYGKDDALKGFFLTRVYPKHVSIGVSVPEGEESSGDDTAVGAIDSFLRSLEGSPVEPYLDLYQGLHARSVS